MAKFEIKIGTEKVEGKICLRSHDCTVTFEELPELNIAQHRALHNVFESFKNLHRVTDGRLAGVELVEEME